MCRHSRRKSTRSGRNSARSPKPRNLPSTAMSDETPTAMTSAGSTWVFGYGSLVDPESLGRTLGRQVTPGVDFLAAELTGWGRRWNYGVGHVVGAWRRADGIVIDDGVIVALGVVAAADESVNGIVARVSEI